MSRHDSGQVILGHQDHDRKQNYATRRCCHCGEVWVVIPGQPKLRGFCGRCMGVTCGHPKCDPCTPLEQFIENMEKQLPAGHRPIIVAVPG